MLNLFNNDNFYDAIDLIDASIFWKDINGRYLGCNKYLLNMAGLTKRAEIIGKNDSEIWKLIKTDELLTLLENDKIAINQGKFLGEEKGTFEGESRTYLSSKKRLVDNSGHIIGLFGTSLDVTELKNKMVSEKKQALLEEESKIMQVIDLVNTSIYWKDTNGYYLGCNQHVVDMVGLSKREDVIGKTDFELSNYDDAIVFRANDRIAMEKGFFEGEEAFVFPSGQKAAYWSVKNQLLDLQGNVVGVTGNSFNIADQKMRMELEKQRMILNERVQVSQIIDVVNASIYWKDLNGIILGCNKYVLNMFGVKDKQEIIGKNEYDLITSEEAIRITKIDKTVLENGHYEGEEQFTLPSGEEKTYYTIKNQLIDSEGSIIGLVGASLDITPQKEAESLRLENALHKTIEKEHLRFRTIVNQVVHDIISPLSALRMIIPGLTTVPEKQRITLKQAVTQIEDIANDLLKNYRPQENQGKFEVVEEINIEPEMLFISMELSAVLSEKRIEFGALPVTFDHKIDTDAYFAFIQANRKDWLRMLSNLINNAVDAMEGKTGRVLVELRIVDDNVIMVIADTGKGMTSVVRDKILQGIAVTEGKKNGHGIGMTQVADTLRKIKGTLAIETRSQGTRMILTFPRAAQPDWAITKLTLNSDQIVLILDDDQFIHGAWEARFAPILEINPRMKLIHFTEGDQLLNYLASINQSELNKVYFLSDYELLNQKMNGLDIIEQQKMNQAILVTSHYANTNVIARAKKLKTFVLPKRLASKVPIEIIPVN